MLLLLQRAQRQRLVVRIVLDQQDRRLRGHDRPSAAEREVEGRALPDSRLGPDPAAVAVDDALHGRQPDAGARELVRARAAAGRRRRACRRTPCRSRRRCRARSTPAARRPRRRAELDARRRLRGRELPGVAEQVLQSRRAAAAGRRCATQARRDARPRRRRSGSASRSSVERPRRQRAEVDRLAVAARRGVTRDRSSRSSISSPMRWVAARMRRR